MGLSALSFCLMTIFVKIAGEQIGTMQIVFMRGVITLLFTYAIIRKKKVWLWGKNHRVLILRGLIGTIALFFVYESIQRLSLSEATVIQYLYPIFTTMMASVLISEHVGKKLYFSVLLGFGGVYLILGSHLLIPTFLLIH